MSPSRVRPNAPLLPGKRSTLAKATGAPAGAESGRTRATRRESMVIAWGGAPRAGVVVKRRRASRSARHMVTPGAMVVSDVVCPPVEGTAISCLSGMRMQGRLIDLGPADIRRLELGHVRLRCCENDAAW